MSLLVRGRLPTAPGASGRRRHRRPDQKTRRALLPFGVDALLPYHSIASALDGAEGARLSKSHASCAATMFGTAFDLQKKPRRVSVGSRVDTSLVIQLRLTLPRTFLALHRSQAEFFSGSDDPCGLSTNSTSSVRGFQCNVPNMMWPISRSFRPKTTRMTAATVTACRARSIHRPSALESGAGFSVTDQSVVSRQAIDPTPLGNWRLLIMLHKIRLGHAPRPRKDP